MDVRMISSQGFSRPVTPPMLGSMPASDQAVDRRPTVPQYASPHVTFDPLTQMSIIAFRDIETGQVKVQYPSEEVVQRYRRIQATDPVAPAGSEAESGGSAKTESNAAGSGTAPRGGADRSAGSADPGSADPAAAGLPPEAGVRSLSISV